MRKAISILLLWITTSCWTTAEERILPITEFINLATQRDTEFQAILIDELSLAYEEALQLPARDLVLSVREEYVAFLEDSQEDLGTSIRLSKLFPMSGTEVAAEYEVNPNSSLDDPPSKVSIEFGQPIARNAFGRSTRLLNRIVGLEIEIARHQVVEAYEDYLANILVTYYNWWAAQENLRIGESSYLENLKLLDNIVERQKSRIAVPLDVNKTRLQMLAKRESLIELGETYSNRLYSIERIIRHDRTADLVPQQSDPLASLDTDFEDAYTAFKQEARTFRVLELLEQRSDIAVDREADDLLPSIQLLVGLERDGKGHELSSSQEMIYAGLSLEWPFPDQVDRAEHEVAKIDQERTRLQTRNTHQRLYNDLRNLYIQIDRERQLVHIAEEKIALARSILEDETENYTFGKVTLNDYIDAVNVLDNNRFSQIRHDALQKIFLVDWLRLTDQLVTREQIEEQNNSSIP